MGIIGFKSNVSKSGDYVANKFKTGLIMIYDEEDKGKYLCFYFTLELNISASYQIVAQKTLEIIAFNNQGSTGVKNGSGNYIYNVIGFIGG